MQIIKSKLVSRALFGLITALACGVFALLVTANVAAFIYALIGQPLRALGVFLSFAAVIITGAGFCWTLDGCASTPPTRPKRTLESAIALAFFAMSLGALIWILFFL